MIGGNDVVFPAVGDSAAMEACARIIVRQWPAARFENAVTGEKYRSIAEIPFGNLSELLTYPNADAEAAWDFDSPESAENSMLYLIVRPSDLTVVVDDPNTAEMQLILEAISGILRTDMLSNHSSAA